MRLASNEGAWANHSSVTGRASRWRVRLHPADQRLQRPARLAARLARHQVPELGVPRERGRPVAREVSRLDGELGRLVRDRDRSASHRSASSTASRQRHCPIASRARRPSACWYCRSSASRRGDPLLELGRPADREPVEKSRDVEPGGRRVLRHGGPEFDHVAGAVGGPARSPSDRHVPPRRGLAKVLERLTRGGPGPRPPADSPQSRSASDSRL